MTNIAPQGTLHVFEVVNYDRRERLLVLAADGLVALAARLARPRPRPILHWEPAELFAVEQLAAAAPVAEAESLVKRFLAEERWRGWRTLVWRG